MGLCQKCFGSKSTKHVTFHQNIGMVVLRQHKEVDGNLCKGCAIETFWSMTLTTLFLGWWGVISFIMTPFYIVNNLIMFVGILFWNPDPRYLRENVPPDTTNRFMMAIENELDEGQPIELMYQYLRSIGADDQVAKTVIAIAAKFSVKSCDNCNLHYKISLSFCPECGSELRQKV